MNRLILLCVVLAAPLACAGGDSSGASTSPAAGAAQPASPSTSSTAPTPGTGTASSAPQGANPSAPSSSQGAGPSASSAPQGGSSGSSTVPQGQSAGTASAPTPTCMAAACVAHSTCVIDDGKPACLCDTGFVPQDDACVLDPQTTPDMPSACAQQTCSGHGRCELILGIPVCLCAAGYRARGLQCLPPTATNSPEAPTTPLASPQQAPGPTSTQPPTTTSPPSPGSTDTPTPSAPGTTVAPGAVSPPAGTKRGAGTWASSVNASCLPQLHASWYYTWRGSPAGVSAPADMEFVPMVWSAKDAPDAAAAAANGNTLLGFNEPDHPDQATMSVAQAVSLWPQLVATGKRLGSPAPGSNASVPGAWLDEFMQQARAQNLRVDFITLHWYGPHFDTATAVQELQTYVQDVYNRYHLPIWVTEYALIDYSHGTTYPSEELQTAFAQASAHMLDGLPYVERYAWFAVPPWGSGGKSNLCAVDGSLTPTGKAYTD